MTRVHHLIFYPKVGGEGIFQTTITRFLLDVILRFQLKTIMFHICHWFCSIAPVTHVALAAGLLRRHRQAFAHATTAAHGFAATITTGTFFVGCKKWHGYSHVVIQLATTQQCKDHEQFSWQLPIKCIRNVCLLQ